MVPVSVTTCPIGAMAGEIEETCGPATVEVAVVVAVVVVVAAVIVSTPTVSNTGLAPPVYTPMVYVPGCSCVMFDSVKLFICAVPDDVSCIPLWSINTSGLGRAVVGNEMAPLETVNTRGVALTLAVPVITGVGELEVRVLPVSVAVGALAACPTTRTPVVSSTGDAAPCEYTPTV